MPQIVGLWQEASSWKAIFFGLMSRSTLPFGNNLSKHKSFRALENHALAAS